jgi:hypothetical protein
LQELESENARLKKIVAEQAVDIDILKEVSQKTSEIETRRRAAVEHVRRRLGVSARRACRAIAQPRSSQRYAVHKADPDRALDCSEVPNNRGGSITNSAETIAAGVILTNELPTPLVWIEHLPKETTDVDETFELVVYSSYEVTERAPYLGETRVWIGDATWKTLDCTAVESLVGGKV